MGTLFSDRVAPILSAPFSESIVLNYLWFFLAALFEIFGCYAFWLWLRQGKSALWVIPALISLTLFALLLTRVESAYAGRAYAAYGGIYIVASIAWLGLVERVRPLGTDWLGLAFCVIGATIILLGPRWSAA
ncbi:UPF0060 membrane protein [Pseudomonas amygdali pv. myricae]|nr:UPF0060 membrane protein [Pseudomonas amygdali pv. myricae]